MYYVILIPSIILGKVYSYSCLKIQENSEKLKTIKSTQLINNRASILTFENSPDKTGQKW